MSAGAASGPSLLDDAKALTTRRGSVCSVDMFYASRPDLSAELREALNADVSASAIAAALKRRGIDLPEGTLARHRRGACRCER